MRRFLILMDGSFVEKTVLKAPSGITPYSLACDDRDNFLILGWGRAPSGRPILGFYQAHDRLVLAGADGEIRAEFGERLVSERLGMATGSRPHPAGRATRVAIHDGRVLSAQERSSRSKYGASMAPWSA